MSEMKTGTEKRNVMLQCRYLKCNGNLWGKSKFLKCHTQIINNNTLQDERHPPEDKNPKEM